MVREKIIKLYTFEELSDKAKERARDWYREGALDHEWWDATYEDAERAGLKIEEFDLDRNKHVKGSLIVDPIKSIEAILKDHGKDCATYKMAKEFQKGYYLLDKNDPDYEEDLEKFTEEYTEALCEEYAQLLQDECDYLLSDESVDNMIIANGYEFDENGKRTVA
jgi:hypothetical protein